MKAVIVFINDDGTPRRMRSDVDATTTSEAAEVLAEVLSEFVQTDQNYEPGLSEPGRTTPSSDFYKADLIQRFERQMKE